MKNVLVIGSLNMDMVVTSPYIPKAGETIMGSDFRTNTGGKGANQAAAIAKLGGNVRMLGCVGRDDFGEKLKKDLNCLGIDISSIGEIEQQSSGIAVITVSEKADNNIVVVPGANRYCTPAFIESNRKFIEQSDIILLQMEIPIETIYYSIRMAYELNKIIILNPAPASHIEEEIYPMIDYLIPNESELEILSGKKLSTLDHVMEAGKEMINKGIKNLIVTLGEKGSLYMNKDNYIKTDSKKVKAIDTTAAGDSFIASFIIGLLEEKDIKESIAFATKVASVVVCKKGAIESIPTKNELKHIIG